MFARLAVIALAAVAATACENTNQRDWAEWKMIDDTTSIANLAVHESKKFPFAIRQAREDRNSGAYEEQWVWTSGQAYVFKPGAERYLAFNPISVSPFMNEYKNWPKLDQIEFVIESEDVQRGVNEEGNYFYAISRKNNSGEICFVFFQGFRLFLPVDHETQTPSEQAGGMLSGYDCQSANEVTEKNISADMLPMLDGIQLK